MRRPIPTYKPDKRSACLYGSGKLFKECCASIYKKPRTLAASWDALQQSRYELAMKLARADITRYTIWHKSHTEPVLPTDNPRLLWLLNIDIEALSELVDVLMHCYRATNQWHVLPAVLDRLEPNIQDPRWQHKIILYHALHAVGLEWDNKEGAQQELKRLPPIEEVNDVDILTFYLDINGDDLTLKELLDLADRIVDLTEDPGIAFNYCALKGFYSILLGELSDAERQMSRCIEELRTARAARLSPFVEKKLAMALATKAAIRLNSMDADIRTARDLGEARSLYNKLLRECKFTPRSEADIYMEMADTYCYEADWKSARHYYDLAHQSVEDDAIYTILSAKCDIHLGELKPARHKLQEVDRTKLTHRDMRITPSNMRN